MEKRWQCIKETTPCLSRMRSSGGASHSGSGGVRQKGVESEIEGGQRVGKRGDGE